MQGKAEEAGFDQPEGRKGICSILLPKGELQKMQRHILCTGTQ